MMANTQIHTALHSSISTCLQRVQNSAAQAVTLMPGQSDAKLLPHSLHWLPANTQIHTALHSPISTCLCDYI